MGMPALTPSARLPRRIQAHAGLAHPHQQRAHTCGQCSGAVRKARAGLEHDAGHTVHRDVRADAGYVDHHESAVEHVDLALLDKDDRDPFLDRDRLQRWQQAVGHGAYSPAARNASAIAVWPKRCPLARNCSINGSTAGSNCSRFARTSTPSVPMTVSPRAAA